MADSDEKHAIDSKALADKGALKADTEDEIVKEQDEHKTTAKELMATQEYMSHLRAECDWLIQNNILELHKNSVCHPTILSMVFLVVDFVLKSY